MTGTGTGSRSVHSPRTALDAGGSSLGHVDRYSVSSFAINWVSDTSLSGTKPRMLQFLEQNAWCPKVSIPPGPAGEYMGPVRARVSLFAKILNAIFLSTLVNLVF